MQIACSQPPADTAAGTMSITGLMYAMQILHNPFVLCYSIIPIGKRLKDTHFHCHA